MTIEVPTLLLVLPPFVLGAVAWCYLSWKALRWLEKRLIERLGLDD